jgi:hypothetical protein
VKYQDLKVRDMLRLLAISVVCIVLTIGMLGCRSGAQPFLEGLPIFHHNGYKILLFVLPIMAVLTVGVAIQYLVTTPEQNAKYILKAKANLPPTLSDVDNPNYRVPTWKYILQRPKAQH